MAKLRSFKAKREFLNNHFRYDTMNSWNCSTSFAECVKLHTLDWGGKMPDNAYDFLNQSLGAYDGIDKIISEFTERMNGNFTMGFNGHSGGYLVLYQSEYKFSDYKSRCKHCGQMNYATVIPKPKDNKEKLFHYLHKNTFWVPETYLTQTEARSLFPDMSDDKFVELVKELKKKVPKDTNFTYGQCGRCGEIDGLVNLTSPLRTLSTFPGRSFGGNIDGLENSEVQWMYEIVFEFDKAVAACKKAFVDYVKSHEIEEREVMAPKMIKVAVPA